MSLCQYLAMDLKRVFLFYFLFFCLCQEQLSLQWKIYSEITELIVNCLLILGRYIYFYNYLINA